MVDMLGGESGNPSGSKGSISNSTMNGAPLTTENLATPAALNRPSMETGTLQRESGHFKKLFWNNKYATLTYCCVFWSFGMCVAFLGPTLLDLGCLTSSVFSSMSWVFFCQSLFNLIGSIFGGFLIERFNPHKILFISVMSLPISFALIPFSSILGALAVILAIMGFFMGCIDTVANSSMIALYGKDVAPFLQALHFFYGLGAFVSPMIAEPFLLNEDCSPFIDNSTTPVNDLGIENMTLPAANLVEAQKRTKVKYAFWIMALVQIPVVLIVLSLVTNVLWFKKDNDPLNDLQKKKQKNDYENIDKLTKHPQEDLTHGSPATPSQVTTITGLTAFLLFLYDGLQASMGGYVYSYAVKGKVGLNPTKAAYLNACFWGTFALGRLLSIPAATRLAPAFMLVCNIIGCLFAMILMLGLQHDLIALYVGTCIFGIFLSSIYPSAVALAEQYINITNTITSCIVVGASAGEMIFPVVIGHMFETLGPVSFLATGNITCFCSMIVFLLIWMIGGTIVKYKASQNPFLSCITCCMQEDDDEDAGLMKHHVRYYSRMSESSSNMELNELNDPDQPRERKQFPIHS